MKAPLYDGDHYLDLSAIEALCRGWAQAHPRWVRVEEVGQTRHGRPLLLITLTAQTGDDDRRRPGFWLDAGTHAAEYTGPSAALWAVSRWIEALEAGDPEAVAWFSRCAVYVMPCIAADGYDAMRRGAPFLRSTLRPPPEGTARAGLEPRDLDGDGAIRWMRWRHPAGPWVQDDGHPLHMRPRTLDDRPEDAWFVATEGELLRWDGYAWTAAPREFTLDLNRNFTAHWAPFSMFGMDGGAYALSEPESRAVTDAFAARPFIGAALTHHTYTGCLLTQPYRAASPLPQADLRLMEWLARQAVQGTPWRVYRVHPDFSYDPQRDVVGVWADTLATVFGVPGFTCELWDPWGEAGVTSERPMELFMRPTPEQVAALLRSFDDTPGAWAPWTPLEHPQLGAVEVGGLDYLRTVRNPPERLLRRECERAFLLTERLRRALPDLRAEASAEALAPGLHRVTLRLENLGCLPTSGLLHGATLPSAPRAAASLEALSSDLTLEACPDQVALEHLDGWGLTAAGAFANPLYPGLGARGHRQQRTWLVRGSGELRLSWLLGRAGEGALTLTLPASDEEPS